jgi:predicted KAP-like P-loop ATPase
MEEQEKYTADKPVSEETEDRFQRYPFSKRIAETIISRSSSESIVFGLFGAWGEGKSSVINFINQELNNEESIIQIHLNPWRYSDEDTMLFAFFKKITDALGKKLQTNSEKTAGFVKKYASAGSVFGFDFSGIGNSIAKVDLELLKNRVDEFLNESTSKIVVFIDDIDRLDKQEIYSLFRLVKLTADFSNTTYILSFDESMVAAAIGERFGAGDVKSGASFLEKIIQVPLNIPKAQPEALKKFCFNFVDNAFHTNKLDLPKSDVQRYVLQFTTNILPRLNTPRLAVRYGNTISFSIPLLNGEVNMIDLLLIEAVKIFYPAHYEFIKHNAQYFIGSYKEFITRDQDKAKIDQLNKHLDDLGKELSEQQKNQVRSLLTDLFPVLNTVFGNFWQNEGEENDWYRDKKIGSAKYFDRYFSYAVIEGDISDIEFNEFLDNISDRPDDENQALIVKMLEGSEPGNLIAKLRSHEQNMEWGKVEKLAKAVSNISKSLPNSGGMLGFGFDTTYGQAAIFIYQLLKHHKDENIYALAKEMMTFPKDFTFAYNVNNWLRLGDRPEDKLFKEEQYDELAALLYKRSVADAGDESIFVKFPDHMIYLANAWYQQDKAGLEDYAKSFMDRDKGNVLSLLKAFVPVGRSNVREGEYKADITEGQYRYITSLFDKDELMRRITENFSIEEIMKEKPFIIDFGEKEYTDLNMVRQFQRWYQMEAEKAKQ